MVSQASQIHGSDIFSVRTAGSGLRHAEVATATQAGQPAPGKIRGRRGAESDETRFSAIPTAPFWPTYE